MARVHLGFDEEQLASLIEKIKENPEEAKTVWRAVTKWQGGFRSRAHIPRKEGEHVVEMDEPSGLGGTDTAPNMVETVLGAYGCCLTTGLVANAAMRGIKLEGVEIELEGDLDLQCFLGLKDPEDSWPGYTEVRTKVKLTAPTASQQELQELYEHVMKTSPVGSIIAKPVPIKGELVAMS